MTDTEIALWVMGVAQAVPTVAVTVAVIVEMQAVGRILKADKDEP